MRCCSATIGSIVYCLGGDEDDIERFSDILEEKSSTGVGGCSSYQSSTLRHQCSRQGICHRIRYCDFGDKEPEWKIGASLVSPRYFPKMVESGGKLYVFGGNHPSENDFAEVFDPTKGCWEALPIPPFGRMCPDDFVVVSLSISLLYNTRNGMQYWYDTIKWKWLEVLENVGNFGLHFSSILEQPTVVDEEYTFYWIDRHERVIRAFDFKGMMHYTGPLVGLCHDPRFQSQGYFNIPLFHLEKDLFVAFRKLKKQFS